MSYPVGEVVQLKSGGPRMTVKSVNGDDTDCVWFEKSKQHSGTFPTALLTKAGSGFAGGRLSRS